MEIEKMSCIDCAVKNCDKEDKAFPEFCVTTHLNQEVLQDALECYREEENHATMVAAAEVEYEHYCRTQEYRRSWLLLKRSGRRRLVSPPVSACCQRAVL